MATLLIQLMKARVYWVEKVDPAFIFLFFFFKQTNNKQTNINIYLLFCHLE